MVPRTEQQKEWGYKYYIKNKEAIIARSAQWQKDNPEKRRLKVNRYRNKYPIRELLYKAKGRAEKRGFGFNLIEEDFYPLPTHCPVLGIELIYTKNGRQPGCISLDRFDNDKGYTKDNVRLISLRANVLKSNGSIEDFEKILTYMKNTNAN